MSIQIIIRVDDISDRFDFHELKKWFMTNFNDIPISFYVTNTHHRYSWRKKDWNSIKETILNYKWEIGGHTRSHSHLTKLPTEKLKIEITENLRDIQESLKEVGLEYEITSFAYPYGEFDDRVKEVLKENKIIYGLTYTGEKQYESLKDLSKNDLFQIGISCNAKGSLNEWNERFIKVYENGSLYILCLHTPQWKKARNRNNLMRIIYSKSLKEFHSNVVRFFKYLFKKSESENWHILKQHLIFIKNHLNIQFITFKDLL